MLAFLISILFVFNTPDSVTPVAVSHHAYSSADSTAVEGRYIYIDNIFIIGNKQTRDKIILREMSLKRGEYYFDEDLKDIIKSDRSKIINTRLFNTVEITTLELADGVVDVVVRVSERWYTFPAPIFDLVDRNFNDWWQNQNHDFSRVNYGLKLYRNNMRGRNETLKLEMQFGFTKQFGLSYDLPYIDRAQRHGISIDYLYAENKNIAIRTVEHKRIFFDSESLLKLRRLYNIGYRFRNSFYTRHTVNITFNDNEINDTIANINPEYYLNSQTSQRYFSISYDLNIDKRDVNSYPLHGHRTVFSVDKFGLGFYNDLDQFSINVNHARFLNLTRNFYLSNYSAFYFSGPERQPYANLRGLGYRKDFVRGYELYVIEGQKFYLNRTTLKKRIFDTKLRLNFLPIEQFRDFPLAIYIKTYFDMGYVENFENYEQNTRLTNRYLFGTGAGIDFVTYYDTVIRFEYSVNREKEAGIFLHLKKEF
ncbi:BamA/TamA family outer membrane protein [Fulvivirga sp. 29W222]|uniref:BamA/TamA family outer membrane protein n=1 Tax=Fulvivirga marina TaxID=2494733 RepID=A0A937KAE1_9BACT|nr:BamA/TamA family outer membrane protein [Fulvivirga marina]MBL6445246.1 BamA/TamA family outer membrane protein [Fulvivirga marina]